MAYIEQDKNEPTFRRSIFDGGEGRRKIYNIHEISIWVSDMKFSFGLLHLLFFSFFVMLFVGFPVKNLSNFHRTH